MPQVTIKPKTGGHTEWPNGKQVIYNSDSPPFEVSEEAFATFRNKFILVDEPESPEIDAPEDKEKSVEVSPEKFAAFMNKIDPVGDTNEVDTPERPEPDVSEDETEPPKADASEDEPDHDASAGESFIIPGTSITDVMAAIEAGQISIEDALDQETKADRPRQSLLRKLSLATLKDGEQ